MLRLGGCALIGSSTTQILPTPTLLPLGDCGLLVRFGTTLDEATNAAAIALTRQLEREPLPNVLEVMPNLVSVLLRYDPRQTTADRLAGELRLRLGRFDSKTTHGRDWTVSVTFDGPDLTAVAQALGMAETAFIAAHNRAPLRVLATGFAPGFVYCGLHAPQLILPRRTAVRSSVKPGSVLFAAGQTAITATEMPTGWHVIGRTDFANFNPDLDPPTRLMAGDSVRFEVAP